MATAPTAAHHLLVIPTARRELISNISQGLVGFAGIGAGEPHRLRVRNSTQPRWPTVALRTRPRSRSSSASPAATSDSSIGSSPNASRQCTASTRSHLRSTTQRGMRSSSATIRCRNDATYRQKTSAHIPAKPTSGNARPPTGNALTAEQRAADAPQSSERAPAPTVPDPKSQSNRSVL